ncbi:response regulator [Chakrabartyella piscis]|uniref:response regulator n=1 Tax=Chakrabartyella piscis TaxID=2918914 RepID=UPI00295857EB|nr:response regulator [Chakrabartyella piscis]
MSHKEKILIIEDEAMIRKFMETTLKSNGYQSIAATTGKEALIMMSSHCPDLVILDLGLPDMEGTEILRDLRRWSNLPLIVVSARSAEKDKVLALDLGADDYIVKPFGTSEFLARIRTALRHNHTHIHPQSNQLFQTKDLTIDFEKHLILLKHEEIHLTQIEFKLVSILAKAQGKVLTYDHLITEIWGPYATKDNQILRVNMANIRRKLEQNPAEPEYVFTEVGVGYRIAMD